MSALRLLQSGMQRVVAVEALCWVLFNGSVHMHELCSHLVTCGYAQQMVEYLSFTLLAFESTVALHAPHHLLWRMRLYLTTAKTYEHLHQFGTSLRVIERARCKVAQLTAWEHSDPPVPAATTQALNDANKALNVFTFKYRFLMGGWTETQAIEVGALCCAVLRCPALWEEESECW